MNAVEKAIAELAEDPMHNRIQGDDLMNNKRGTRRRLSFNTLNALFGHPRIYTETQKTGGSNMSVQTMYLKAQPPANLK